MPYIRTQVANGNYRKLTDISSGFNGTTTTFILSVPPGTTLYYITPGTYQLFISLGGIIQQPDVDYTIVSNTIKFTTAPASGLSFFGIYMGDALSTGTPSDGTVTDAKVAFGAGIAASKVSFSALGNYANDAAAAADGVSIGSLYRNGSAVQVRVN